jgi:predicted alpha/beta hydrolase
MFATWRARTRIHLVHSRKSIVVNRITFAARDGQTLVGYRFDPPGRPRASVIIAAAMAVPQSFYAPFALHLALQGFAVWSFDYRGTGESLQGSMRGAKASLTEWYTCDYDAVLNMAADTHPGIRVFAVGHSFGGQATPLLPSRTRLAGLINIAVGSGAMRHVTPRIRRNAFLMWYLLVPLLCTMFGFFPGERLGVIGNVPSGAIFQWRRWCLTPDYILSGEPGARAAYASADFPVLGLTFADDELLLEAGSRMLHAAYVDHPADYRVIEPATFGMKRIGHFGFFKPQSEAALWPMVTKWLEETCEANPDPLVSIAPITSMPTAPADA